MKSKGAAPPLQHGRKTGLRRILCEDDSFTTTHGHICRMDVLGVHSKVTVVVARNSYVVEVSVLVRT